MNADPYIRARFFVTKSTVTIYARYHEANVTFRWKRLPGQEEETLRHIKTLIRNLEQLVHDGLQEVVIQLETRDLDQEWLELDEPPATEEPTGE
jgi:hypothetical protein